MVKQFNKNTLPEIKAAMNLALRDVGEKFGIEINVGNGSYTAHETTFKVKLSILDEDGESKQDKSDFMLYALNCGFDAEDFGRIFTVDGRQFRITGWSSRRRKYSITTVLVKDNTPWFFTPRTVLRALGKPGSGSIVSR